MYWSSRPPVIAYTVGRISTIDFSHRLEEHVEQDKDQPENDRQDNGQALSRAQLELVLSRPFQRVSGGQMELPIEHALRVVNVAAVVRGREVNIDVAGELPVFVADHRGARAQVDMRDFAERNLRAGWRHDQYATKRVQVVAIVREIADVDRVALATFDGGRDILAAHAGANRALNVSDCQPVPRGDSAVDIDVDVEPL